MSTVKRAFLENVILVTKVLAVLVLIRSAMLLAGYGGHIPVVDQIIQSILDALLELSHSVFQALFG